MKIHSRPESNEEAYEVTNGSSLKDPDKSERLGWVTLKLVLISLDIVSSHYTWQG